MRGLLCSDLAVRMLSLERLGRWTVPPGLGSFSASFPAPRRWAKFDRPSGAAFRVVVHPATHTQIEFVKPQYQRRWHARIFAQPICAGPLMTQMDDWKPTFATWSRIRRAARSPSQIRRCWLAPWGATREAASRPARDGDCAPLYWQRD